MTETHACGESRERLCENSKKIPAHLKCEVIWMLVAWAVRVACQPFSPTMSVS